MGLSGALTTCDVSVGSAVRPERQPDPQKLSIFFLAFPQLHYERGAGFPYTSLPSLKLKTQSIEKLKWIPVNTQGFLFILTGLCFSSFIPLVILLPLAGTNILTSPRLFNQLPWLYNVKSL